MKKKDVHEALRFDIITNAIASGEILKEKALMAAYGIGRSPLRDVLIKLQEEGLIKTIPRLGSMVTTLDIAEIRELLEVRRELEGFAASLAARRITSQQLDALQAIFDRAAGESPDEHLAGSIANYFDTQLHHTLYQAACNRKLDEILQRQHVMMLRLWFHMGLETIRFSTQAETLYALMAALEQKDPLKARSAMEAHIDLYAARVKAKFL